MKIILKNITIVLFCLVLTGCLKPPSKNKYKEEIGQSKVFHWQNDFVTFPKFVEDHKDCLGAGGSYMRSSWEKIISPLTPRTVPNWDGIWATFENRQFADAGSRISVSTPSGRATTRPSRYKKCMLDLGYILMYY